MAALSHIKLIPFYHVGSHHGLQIHALWSSWAKFGAVVSTMSSSELCFFFFFFCFLLFCLWVSFLIWLHLAQLAYTDLKWRHSVARRNLHESVNDKERFNQFGQQNSIETIVIQHAVKTTQFLIQPTVKNKSNRSVMIRMHLFLNKTAGFSHHASVFGTKHRKQVMFHQTSVEHRDEKHILIICLYVLFLILMVCHILRVDINCLKLWKILLKLIIICPPQQDLFWSCSSKYCSMA